MDVAADNWATTASNPTGPISAKLAILMKNALSLLPNTIKIWLKNGQSKTRERGPHLKTQQLYFFSRLSSSSSA